MGTKNNPGEYDCYADLEPDEPHFVLRAKDASSPWLVKSWAQQRQREIELGLKPKSDGAKVAEALRCADSMVEWRKDRAIAATTRLIKGDDDAGPA